MRPRSKSRFGQLPSPPSTGARGLANRFLSIRGTGGRVRRGLCEDVNGSIRREQPAGWRPARGPGQGRRGRRGGPDADPPGVQALAAQRGHTQHPPGAGRSLRPRAFRRPARGRMAAWSGACRAATAGQPVGLQVWRAGGAVVARLAVLPADGLPPRCARLLGVGGRRNAVGLRPGELLLRAEAAAVPPALLRTAAATGMAHARVGPTVVFFGGKRHGQAKGGDTISQERNDGGRLAGEGPPGDVPSLPPHAG